MDVMYHVYQHRNCSYFLNLLRKFKRTRCLKQKIKLFIPGHQFIDMQQELSSHGRAAVVAQDVADVVGGAIGLFARVGGRGVGERQQRRHGHG